VAPRNLWRLGAVVILVALFAVPSHAQQTTGGDQAVSIEGNYVLVSREFPNGAPAKTSDVEGMMTFTKTYRNFNISWKTADGKHVSIAYVAEYTLTPDSYQEKPIYWLSYDGSHGAADYTVPKDKTKPTRVTAKDGTTSFDISGEGVTVTFDSDGMTAVMPGQFIDHWKRVN
jgi:hypothetical protein